MWIIVSVMIMIIVMVLFGYYIMVSKKTRRTAGRGMSEGLAIGLLVSSVVCILLREVAGVSAAPDFLLPSGIALGGIIGLFLERRYQKS